MPSSIGNPPIGINGSSIFIRSIKKATSFPIPDIISTQLFKVKGLGPTGRAAVSTVINSLKGDLVVVEAEICAKRGFVYTHGYDFKNPLLYWTLNDCTVKIFETCLTSSFFSDNAWVRYYTSFD